VHVCVGSTQCSLGFAEGAVTTPDDEDQTDGDREDLDEVEVAVRNADDRAAEDEANAIASVVTLHSVFSLVCAVLRQNILTEIIGVVSPIMSSY